MAYIVSGPVNVGTTTKQTNIFGNIALPDVGTPAQGDVFYRSASLNLASLPPGINGQVLTTHGPASNPTWENTGASGSNVLGFSARKLGNQGPTSAALPIVITTWNIASPGYDTLGGAFNVGTGVFTAPSTGKYLISAGVTFLNSNNSSSRLFAVRVNGTEIFKNEFQPTSSVIIPQNCSITSQLVLNIGDQVDLVIYRSGGPTTITILSSPNTWFSMSKLA